MDNNIYIFFYQDLLPSLFSFVISTAFSVNWASLDFSKNFEK
jgi:hypothetical protein